MDPIIIGIVKERTLYMVSALIAFAAVAAWFAFVWTAA
jgi:hypothetical protein